MGHGFHSGIAMLSNQISCISLQLQCLIDDHIGALIEDRVPGRRYQRLPWHRNGTNNWDSVAMSSTTSAQTSSTTYNNVQQHRHQHHDDHDDHDDHDRSWSIMIISHDPPGNLESKLELGCHHPCRLLSKESHRRPGVAFEVHHRYEDFVPNGNPARITQLRSWVS